MTTGQLPSRRAVMLGLAGAAGTSLMSGASSGASIAVPSTAIKLLSTYVAGAAHLSEPRVYQGVHAGQLLTLRRRVDNAYDTRTVEVLTADGFLLGHIPRIDNQALANLMDAGIVAVARVTSVGNESDDPDIQFDVLIEPPV